MSFNYYMGRRRKSQVRKFLEEGIPEKCLSIGCSFFKTSCLLDTVEMELEEYLETCEIWDDCEDCQHFLPFCQLVKDDIRVFPNSICIIDDLRRYIIEFY